MNPAHPPRQTGGEQRVPLNATWSNKRRKRKLIQPSCALVLNLTEDGKPLTYALAKSGAESGNWTIAEEEEFDRLFESKTLKPITPKQIPQDRWSDVSYYNRTACAKRKTR